MQWLEFSPLLGSLVDRDWDDPEAQGRLGAAVIFGLLSIFGMIRCAIAMVRTEVQTMGPLSVFLLWLLWFVALITAALQPTPLIRSIIGFVLILGMLVGVVLGIIGIVVFNLDQRRGEEARYTRGRTYAIWGLVLHSIWLVVSAITFVVITVKGVAERQGFAGVPPKLSSPAEPVSFEDLNFAFEAPNSNWISVSPKVFNPVASIVLRKRRADMSFIIIAERGGVDLDIDSAGLAEIVRSNSESGFDNAVVSDSDPVSVSGIDFIATKATGMAAGKQLHQHAYVAEKNGFYYQLISLSTVSPDDAEKALKELAPGFKQIDPEAVCYSTGHAFSESVERPELGLAAKLEASGWMDWDAIKDDFGVADFGARYSSYSMMGLVSFDLRNHEVSLDDLAAASTWVLWGEADYPDDFDEIESFDFNGIEGLELRMTHKVGAAGFVDVIRVFEHEGRGWCVLLWIDESVVDRLDDVVKVFDLIEPGAATVAFEDADFSEEQIEVRGNLFNRLGLERYQDKDYETAIPLFETALEMAPKSSVFLLNIAYAYEQMNRFEDAMKFLESHLAEFADDSGVVAEIAWNLDQLGESEQAATRYAEAFGMGYENEDYLTDYVQLLTDLERSDDALAALVAYEEKYASDTTLLWRASVLVDLDRTEESIEILEKRLEKKPFNGGVAYDLASYYLDSEAPEKCLAVCQRIIDDDEETWDVASLRGQAYMFSGRLSKCESGV